MDNPLELYIHRENEDAVIPEVAYNGTSAAFDITATETVTIEAKSSAIIPNGLNIVILEDKPFYMTINLRSSLGFKQQLIPHHGIIDAGYTGPLSVLIHNLSDKDVVINKGDRYAQILLHRKISYKFIEVNDEEFNKIKESQQRGNNGFGSSGK